MRKGRSRSWNNNMGPLIVSLVFPLAITATYFFASKEPSLPKRVLSSAHGALLVLSLGYAWVASRWSTFDAWYLYIWPFYLLLAAFRFFRWLFSAPLQRYKARSCTSGLPVAVCVLVLAYRHLGDRA